MLKCPLIHIYESDGDHSFGDMVGTMLPDIMSVHMSDQVNNKKKIRSRKWFEHLPVGSEIDGWYDEYYFPDIISQT